MELTELEALLVLLRKYGVTSYSGGTVSLQLGEAPAVAPAVDLQRDGFTPSTGRAPELERILNRLNPQYGDPALFEIVERQR